MFSKFRLSPYFFFRYEANNDGGAGTGTGAGEKSGQGEPETGKTFDTFEAWYDSLSEDQKKLVAHGKEHFDKVYSTLGTVRGERDDLSKQLRDAVKKMKDGPDKDQLQNALDDATRRADFYEEVTTHNCNNPKAAFALAKSLELFDKKGNVDWDKLLEEAPQLFGETDAKKKVNKVTAGNGTGKERPSTMTMNDWIRAAAGKS